MIGPHLESQILVATALFICELYAPVEKHGNGQQGSHRDNQKVYCAPHAHLGGHHLPRWSEVFRPKIGAKLMTGNALSLFGGRQIERNAPFGGDFLTQNQPVADILLFGPSSGGRSPLRAKDFNGSLQGGQAFWFAHDRTYTGQTV